MAFLQEFLKNKPVFDIPNEHNIAEMLCWAHFWSFLCKSHLILDINLSQFNEYKNNTSVFAQLWKDYTNGKCKLDFCPSSFPDLKNDQLPKELLGAMFLVDKEGATCKKIGSKCGVFVLNATMLKDLLFLYQDSGCAIPDPENKIKGWSFLAPLSSTYPGISVGNSMIIVDNFILNKENDNLKRNLLRILDLVLPKRLSIDGDYEISIFSHLNNTTEESKCKYLIEEIKTLRGGEYSIKVNIMNVQTSDFHDRSIITNNVWIGCGHGFDIFKQDNSTTQSTTVNVLFPFITTSVKWVDNAYSNLITDAKRIINRTHKHMVDYWGDMDLSNRMLSSTISDENTIDKQKTEVFKTSVNMSGPKILRMIDLSSIPRR